MCATSYRRASRSSGGSALGYAVMGIRILCLGDHVYKKVDIVPTLQSSERIVRPANLSAGAAGRTHTVVTTNSGVQVGVFCLLGRIFMNQLPSDDPFAAADKVLAQIPKSVR